MANRRVTDLEPLATAPTAGVLHFVDVTNATQNAAGSSFKVTKADFLKESTAAIVLNTAKVGYTEALVSANVSVVANTAKTGITTGQSSAIVLNTAKTGISTEQSDAIILNTAKTGISTSQASAIVTNTASALNNANAISVNTNSINTNITAIASNTNATATNATAIALNTAKVGYTEALVSANTSVVANTAKVGITSGQASAIVTNTAKVGITTGQATAIAANTTKVGITSGQATAIAANTAKVGVSEVAQTFNGDKTFANDVFINNGVDDVRFSRVAGANSRLVISRPGFPNNESVSFGGGNEQLYIQGGLGQIKHGGTNFEITNSASGALLFTANGNLLFRGSGFNVGITMFSGTRNSVFKNGGTFVDNGVDIIQAIGSILCTTLKTSAFTVATLPSPPAQGLGAIAHVTDALNPTYLGTLTGGGTVKCPVFYNGTAWVSS
jgi:hypothetical protein